MFYINKRIVRQIDMILKRFVDNTLIFLLKNWVVLNFCSRLYMHNRQVTAIHQSCQIFVQKLNYHNFVLKHENQDLIV